MNTILQKFMLEKFQTSRYPRIFASSAARVALAFSTYPPFRAPGVMDIRIHRGDINRLLDEYIGFGSKCGSSMRLLVSGEKSYRTFWAMIASAQEHINLETLNFDIDRNMPESFGRKFVHLLAAKARQGVRVNVIVDSLAQNYWSAPEMLWELASAGANIRYYMQPMRSYLFHRIMHRTHKKMLIVDGREGIIGGANFGYRYLGPDQWRDTNVHLTGPIVADLQRQFLSDWRSVGGRCEDARRYFPKLAATGKLSIRSVEQRPADRHFGMNTAVVIAIRMAKERIDIETPYFNPPDWLARELLLASEVGVTVRVLTNSARSNNIPDSFAVAASWFRRMLDGNVQIHLWDRCGRTMHSKAIVVDEHFAMLGSYNFNYRSCLWDAESGVIFTDPEAVEQIRKMVEADIDEACVFAIDRAWLESQPAHRRSWWNFSRRFKWLV